MADFNQAMLDEEAKLASAQTASAINAHPAEENVYSMGNSFIEDNQKALRRIDEGVKIIASEGNLEEVEEKTAMRTSQELDDAEVVAMEEERQSTFRDTMDALAGSERADLLPQTMVAAREDFNAQFKRSEMALNPYFARVYNTPGAENLSDEQVANIAIDQYVHDGFAMSIDAQGGLATAGDILNMMVVPDESYNASQLTDANWFTSYEGMLSTAEHRAKLGPADRVMFDQNIQERLSGLESSTVQQYTTMLQLMGEDPNMAATHFLDKFAVLDVLALGGAIVKTLRTSNVMRKMSKGLDKRTMSIIADAAATDKNVAKGVGVPQLDAASAGNPLKESLKDSVLNGTTVNPSTEVRNRTQGVDEALNRVDEVMGPRIYPSDEEALNMASRWKRHMESQKDVEKADVETLIDGVNIKLKTSEGADEVFVPYVLDDLGGFQRKDLSLKGTFFQNIKLASPAILQGPDRGNLVDAATVGTFKRAKAIKLFGDAFNVAMKPLKNKKESITKLNGVLNYLNGKEVDNSRHALTTVGVGGIRLTDKEYDAFEGVRKIFDHLHWHNNSTMRAEMDLKGLRNLDIGGESYYGKRYSTAEDAKKAYNMDIDNNQILKADETGTGTVSRMSDKELEQEYDMGNTLVRVDGNDQYGWFKDSTDNYSRYAIISKDKIGGLPDQVLPYTPNYVPRLRSEANYFVKKKVPMAVNGNKMVRERTVAWARTQQQAEKYLDKLAKADKDNFKADDWGIRFDREGAAGETESVRMNGGLYRGSRSSTNLEYAGDAVDGKEIDALDTLQGAMQYTADRMTMSEWRMGVRHRWLQDAMDIDPNIGRENWQSALGVIERAPNIDPKVRAKLISAHNQISAMSNIPVKSEQKFRGALEALGKHFDARGGESAARWFYRRAKTGSPVDFLKGGAFHMRLGAYNPAQFFVQGMSATSAMAANPIAFAKAGPRIMAAQFTDLIDSKMQRASALRWLRDKKVVSQDYVDDVEFWRQSGMMEAVLRGNADFNNMGKYLPADAGMLRRSWDGLVDKSTIPYEAGELISMRTSFFTALEYYKGVMGKKFNYSELTLEKVVARAEQYRLNMSAANKAEFQKGILALPTQFKSIYTKFIEALGGDWFSNAEKARIVVGQGALFGAAGIPIFNYLQDLFTEMLLPEDASIELQRAVKQGATGWLLSEYWDVDASVTGRVAIAGDVIKEIETMLFADQPFIKSFMGASFTSTDQSIDAVKNMMLAGKMLWEDEDINSHEKVGYAAKYAGYQLAQIPTSTKRLAESYILSSLNEVRTSSGRTLYKVQEEDSQMRDVIARAMGFSSEDMVDIYETNEALYKRKEKVKDLADFYLGVMHSMTISIDEGDEEAVQAAQMVLSAVMRRFHNDKDREDIFNSIQSGLEDRDFQGRTISKWTQDYYSELLSAKGRLFLKGQEEIEEGE